MNILTQLTRQNIRLNRTRSRAALGGIFLAAAMFTILTTSVYSIWDYVRRGTEYETGDYFVSCDFADDEALTAARSDPSPRRISDMAVIGFIGLYDDLGPGSAYPVAAVNAGFFQEMSVSLKEGRLPESSSEITIPFELTLYDLREGGKGWALGETVTLDLFDFRMAQSISEDGWTKLYKPDASRQREYRIVGVTENKALSDDENDWGYYPLLTLADGREGEALWHRLFLKTAPWDAVKVLAKQYGGKNFLNTDLLRVYGGGGMEKGKTIFLILVPAALLIIGIFSAVLIRSIFSVSVSERTREFGLLASLGTTPRQIRGLVRREAWSYLALSLLPGLAAGVLGAAGLLSLYRDALISQFTFGSSVPLSVRLSPIALTSAAIICYVTVLLSVDGPARRASRIIPMEAIRQTRDIRISKRRRKSGKPTSHLLGVPGWVGAQYERNVRRSSRAVTAALALSLILFLPSVYLSEIAEKQADAYTDGFDFDLARAGGQINPEIIETLRAAPEVSDAALHFEQVWYAVFPSDALEEDYKAVMGQLTQKDYSSACSAEEVTLVFLEDGAFSEALQTEGIDPAPYLDGDALFAVTVPFSIGGFAVPDEEGIWRLLSYTGCGADRMPKELICTT